MATLLHVPSRSSLLHASLTHLTPECIAVDAILQRPGRRPRLPTELMLIVRTHLVSDLSDSLAEESKDALAAYSQSLISLLCPDCTSCNTEIYGANVFDWPWDQFSGPCLCSGDIDDCITRTQAFTDNIAKLQCDPTIAPHLFRQIGLGLSACNRNRAEGDGSYLKGGLLQFCSQLLDPQFFLELYLSRQARRFARLAYKEGLKGIRRGEFTEVRRGLLKIRSIWDAVELVLGEQYGCEAIPRQGAFVSTHTTSTLPPTPTTVPRAVKPTSKPKIHTQPPTGASSVPQIVQLDPKDLAAHTAVKSPVSSAPFFPSGLMSTTYRREQDLIYVSLVIPNQRDTSGVRDSAETPVVDDPWVIRALLLHTKNSLGLPSSIPPCSYLTAGLPSNRPRSCNPGETRPSFTPSLRSGNSNVLDVHVPDSTSNYRPRHLSVPSPATKPPPVSSEPTTGITGSTVTAGITEGLLDVDADVHSNLRQVHLANQGVETAIAGVRFDLSRERRLYGRTVVVGAPGAEATRQINGNASAATTSSASSSGLASALLWGGDNRNSKFLTTSIPDAYSCLGPDQAKDSLLSALTLVQSFATACLCAPFAILSAVVTVDKIHCMEKYDSYDLL